MRQTLLIIVVAGVTLANGPSRAADETAEGVALADRLVTRFIEDHERPWGPYPMDLALEAMVALYEATGDEKYKEYVLDVAQRRGWTPDKELRYGSPPFTCLIFEVYRLREDRRYVAPFVRQSRLYRQEIVRTADGLVTHPRGKQRGGGHAVLIDSLQEYAARMAKAGSLSGEESFFEECVAQYELHRKLLRDPETGLWHQGGGWLDEPDRMSPGAWSRGHGWLTRGMVDSLRYLPRDSAHFRRMQKIFQETADALLAVQDEDGMWHALLHLPHEKSAAESSGTGLIAYNLARAVHEGFVPEKPYKPAVLRATAALRRYVTEDGEVLSACPGPGPLDSVEKYLGTTFAPGDHHGTGALIYGFAGEVLLRRGTSRQHTSPERQASGEMESTQESIVDLRHEAKAKTPAEWLELIEAGCLDRRPVSAEFKRLLRGTSIAIGPYTGKPENLAPLQGERKKDYACFRQFMAESGEALLKKWRNGDPVTREEADYYYVLNGVYFSRYHKVVRHNVRTKTALSSDEEDCRDYNLEVERRGKEILRKGYCGKILTREDLESLRLYAMWVDIRCCGGGVLPFHLGLSRATRFGGGRARFQCGDEAPDFSLLRMEAALRIPSYSDLNPYDPTDVLTWNVLREFLLLMQGYEMQKDGSGEDGLRAKPTEVPETTGDDYVRLSSFRGKKPVLLILANPTDTWCWHWKIAPMLEPLYQACKDRMAFFIVNTTIHDTYMPSRDFFGPSPGELPAVHDLSIEQRARTSKMFYMYWPQYTIPYLLDDMSQTTRDAYMDQGGGAYIVLVDLDGKIAYLDYHQNLPPHWGPDGVSFADEYVYIRVNHLESRLKAFFDHGCRYDRSAETPLPTWRRPPDQTTRDHEARGLREPTIWLAGRVKDVNVQQRSVTIERIKPDPDDLKGPRFWQDAGERATAYDPAVAARLEVVRSWIADDTQIRDYHFAVDAAVMLFVNGREAELADLQPDDYVGVHYWSFQEGQKELYPEQIRAYRYGTKMHHNT